MSTDNSLTFIKYTLQDIDKEIYKMEGNGRKLLELNATIARARHLVDQMIEEQNQDK
jgi:hypothetical protein